MAFSCTPVTMVDARRNVSNDMLMLKNEDNGKTITIKLGDIVKIELERYGGTGHEWYLNETYKEHFSLVKEEKEETTKDHLVGTPVIVRWQLKAVQRGNTELRLFLYRNWEGKERAASLFQVGVKIL
jgi:predicted secreted protein